VGQIISMDRAKLALLIPRLASNFDGEVVATVGAIRRVLATSGHDLHDLAQVVAKDPLKTSRAEPHNDCDSRKQYEREWGGPTDPIDFAEFLLETCSRLSDWERDFLKSISDQARRRYGFRLSEKQQAVLDRLRAKYG